ncbi:MAG: CPBP family intramembrane metalloprotease [bacterium]|nr:CPBP family intramembrane metalloprotease [bacterium]
MRRPPAPIEFLLWAGLVVGLSAALTPTVHETLVGLGWLDAAPEAQVGGFLRVLRRLLVGFGLAVLFWRLRPWRETTLEGLGLRGIHAQQAPIWRAALLTALAACVILLIHALNGWLKLEDPLRWGKITRRCFTWAGRAVLLGFIEEWFFRGWLFNRWSRSFGALRAALYSSAIFGVIHAFRPSNFRGEVPLTVSGALEALQEWALLALDPTRFLPAAFGLFLFGLVLCTAMYRTRSLWTPIAIHAAGVWVVTLHPSITNRWPKESWAGSGQLLDGPPGWALLLVGLFLLTRTRPDVALPRSPDATQS